MVDPLEIAGADPAAAAPQPGEPDARVCFVCGKELGWAIDPRPEDGAGAAVMAQPNDATVFTSRGNYGSTLYDQGFMEREYLHAVVCDSCLEERKERVLRVQYRSRHEITSAEPWDGDSPL